MKKTLLVCLCLLVLGVGISPVHALQSIKETPIPDIDLFAAAMADPDIADYYQQCLTSMNEESNWNAFAAAPPFADRYAALIAPEDWLLLHGWQETLSRVGYLPVPALEEPTLVDDGYGCLAYTGSTPYGNVTATFSFTGNGNTSVYYESWKADKTRSHVSCFNWEDGEQGVISFAALSGFSSCKAGASESGGKGYASVWVALDDGVSMRLSFHNKVTHDEAIAFVRGLAIEKRAVK